MEKCLPWKMENCDQYSVDINLTLVVLSRVRDTYYPCEKYKNGLNVNGMKRNGTREHSRLHGIANSRQCGGLERQKILFFFIIHRPLSSNKHQQQHHSIYITTTNCCWMQIEKIRTTIEKFVTSNSNENTNECLWISMLYIFYISRLYFCFKIVCVVCFCPSHIIIDNDKLPLFTPKNIQHFFNIQKNILMAVLCLTKMFPLLRYFFSLLLRSL